VDDRTGAPFFKELIVHNSESRLFVSEITAISAMQNLQARKPKTKSATTQKAQFIAMSCNELQNVLIYLQCDLMTHVVGLLRQFLVGRQGAL